MKRRLKRRLKHLKRINRKILLISLILIPFNLIFPQKKEYDQFRSYVRNGVEIEIKDTLVFIKKLLNGCKKGDDVFVRMKNDIVFVTKQSKMKQDSVGYKRQDTLIYSYSGRCVLLKWAVLEFIENSFFNQSNCKEKSHIAYRKKNCDEELKNKLTSYLWDNYCILSGQTTVERENYHERKKIKYTKKKLKIIYRKYLKWFNQNPKRRNNHPLSESKFYWVG